MRERPRWRSRGTLDAVEDLVGGQELVDHAEPEGPVGVEPVAEQGQLRGDPLTPGVSHHPHVDRGHGDADGHLVEREAGTGLDGDAAVARRRGDQAAGESPAAVRAWLVERYGNWISYRPPAAPIGWPLWGAPLVLLLLGALLVRKRIRLGRQ